MSYWAIFLLAAALSIDACVVSFSYGLVFNENRTKNALKLAFCTGIFQGVMPALGYLLTGFVKNYISQYSAIIVFLIFVYLGGKFIFEANNQEKEKPLCIDTGCLLLVGIATSIDAFSAGVTLALYGNRILKPAVLIALITFINSFSGFIIGGKLKHLPTKWLEISAGIILILLGIKALV